MTTKPHIPYSYGFDDLPIGTGYNDVPEAFGVFNSDIILVTAQITNVSQDIPYDGPLLNELGVARNPYFSLHWFLGGTDAATGAPGKFLPDDTGLSGAPNICKVTASIFDTFVRVTTSNPNYLGYTIAVMFA